jgi:hypothetical protein
MVADCTRQQRSANVDGVLLTGKHLDEYVDKHGRCPICKTVVRKRPQFWSNWEPVTVGPDPVTGEYEVYKGYCIQPTCYTLDQVKIMLGESVETNAQACVN